jgi:5-methylcytosine-specific restriction endonuclease McrA
LGGFQVITATDRTVRTACGQTKTLAIKRGAPWNLTVEEFWDVWEPHWVGRHKRQLHMFRIDRSLPFQAGNVYIGSDRFKINAAAKFSRERDRGRTCDCCVPKDFIAIYREAGLIDAEVDHIVALALGGKHCVKNLQVLTLEQHRMKTNADMREVRSIGNTRAAKRRRSMKMPVGIR